MQFGIGQKDEVKGGSFSDIGRYLDKDRNSPNMKFINLGDCQTLEEAAEQMAWTLDNAAALKRAAGISKRGRPATAEPEMHLWMSWHPDENPSWDEMVEQGMSFVAAIGLEAGGTYGHQIAFVQHTDQQHYHLHMLINRVNSRDGTRWNCKNEHAKLQRWCDAYERERGQNYIPDRRTNLEKNKAWGEEQDRLKKVSGSQNSGGSSGSQGKNHPKPQRERQTDRIWNKSRKQLWAEKRAYERLGKVEPNNREMAQKDVLVGKIKQEVFTLNTLYEGAAKNINTQLRLLKAEKKDEIRAVRRQMAQQRYSGFKGSIKGWLDDVQKEALWTDYKKSARLMRTKFKSNERLNRVVNTVLSLRYEAWIAYQDYAKKKEMMQQCHKRADLERKEKWRDLKTKKNNAWKTLMAQNENRNREAVLENHGRASYLRDRKNGMSYFLQLSNGKIYWGADLERAIVDAGAQPGDRIEVRRCGQAKTFYDKRVVDSQTGEIRVLKMQATRARWNVTVLEAYSDKRTVLGIPEAAPSMNQVYMPIIGKKSMQEGENVALKQTRDQEKGIVSHIRYNHQEKQPVASTRRQTPIDKKEARRRELEAEMHRYLGWLDVPQEGRTKDDFKWYRQNSFEIAEAYDVWGDLESQCIELADNGDLDEADVLETKAKIIMKQLQVSRLDAISEYVRLPGMHWCAAQINTLPCRGTLIYARPWLSIISAFTISIWTR